MKKIEVIPFPFHMVGIDIVGPLISYKASVRYILTLIDYFTKYFEAIPLLNQEGAIVAPSLEGIFARHVMPATLTII